MKTNETTIDEVRKSESTKSRPSATWRSITDLTLALSLTIIGACDAGSEEQQQVRIGQSEYSITADPGLSVTSMTASPPDWNTVTKTVEARAGKRFQQERQSANVAQKYEFSPQEGTYPKLSTTVWSDTCQLSGGQLVKDVVHIVDVDPTAGSFTKFVTEDTGAFISATPCEYWGTTSWGTTFYRCSMDDQVINFGFVGLDAVVTIRNIDVGYWLSSSTFWSYFDSTFSCEGTDCSLPPAANMFGIVQQIPCRAQSMAWSERQD